MNAKKTTLVLASLGMISMLALVSISIASGSATPLTASVVVTNRAPLHAGDGTYFAVFLTNTYPPSQLQWTGPRFTVYNAYVINSLHWDIYVDGALWGAFTFLAPPALGYAPEHWPVSVVPGTCSSDGTTTCQVGSPAVLPGENLAVFYTGWTHMPDDPYNEPNGNYVFVFTVHGTVNGVETDITVRSSTIVMLT